MWSHERDLFRHAQQTHTDVTPNPTTGHGSRRGQAPRQVPSTFRRVEPAPAYLDSASSEPLHPAARAVARGGARHGVRRRAPAARPGTQRATRARQRAGRRGGVPARATRRGDVHAERHPRGAPRPARPARRAPPRRGPDGRALGGRALGGAPCGRLVAGAHGQRAGGRDTGGSTLATVAEAALGVDGGAGVLAVQTANHEVGTVQPVADVAARGSGRATVHGRLCVAGPAPAARRLVGRGRIGAQVGGPGRGRRAAGAQGSPLAQPVPGRRPRGRAHDRLRERAGRPRRRCGAAGRGRGGRGDQPPPARAGGPGPRRPPPRCPTRRWSALPRSGSPTW